MRSDLRAVLDHNSTLVAHTKLKTRMDCYRLARKSFVMLKLAITLYFLSYACGRRKKKERKKERSNE